MTESEFWTKIREHMRLFKWVRLDVATQSGFPDCVLFNEECGACVELKVGPSWDSPKMELRKTQVAFNKSMLGKTKGLYVLRYNENLCQAELERIYGPVNGYRCLFDKTTWERMIKEIEQTIYNDQILR